MFWRNFVLFASFKFQLKKIYNGFITFSPYFKSKKQDLKLILMHFCLSLKEANGTKLCQKFEQSIEARKSNILDFILIHTCFHKKFL